MMRTHKVAGEVAGRERRRVSDDFVDQHSTSPTKATSPVRHPPAQRHVNLPAQHRDSENQPAAPPTPTPNQTSTHPNPNNQTSTPQPSNKISTLPSQQPDPPPPPTHTTKPPTSHPQPAPPTPESAGGAWGRLSELQCEIWRAWRGLTVSLCACIITRVNRVGQSSREGALWMHKSRQSPRSLRRPSLPAVAIQLGAPCAVQ